MAYSRSHLLRLLSTQKNVLGFCTSRKFSVTTQQYKAEGKVGFIGTGNMGGPMALNLIKNGYDIVAYDVNAESLELIEDAGANIAGSPAEVASKADSIISMLPNSHHVRTCYTGAKGVFEALQPGTLILDSSTIDPSVSKEMAAIATKKGSVFMDSPVSGGVNAAKGATLTFMVGGDLKEFEAAKTLLQCMGKNVVYCGEVGNGQAAKICNNMLLGISMIGTAETMNLGMRLGLDPKLLASIINTSSGRCWSSELYNPVPGVLENVPSSNNYEGGFGTALMAKDLGLAQDAATKSFTPTPFGSLAHQIYRIMSSTDLAGKDFSSVFRFLNGCNDEK